MLPSFPRFLVRSVLLLLCTLAGPLVLRVAALDFATLTASVEPERAARYEVFRDFRIKGFCGTSRLDLAVGAGANTIRTYTPSTRRQLDEYQRLGLRVIVGLWMPHHGENKNEDGKWNYDYTTQADKQLQALAEIIDRIGDHPAILLWCFGNEVHLERPYLETVERMSRLLHEKLPRALSSLTMINAPKEKVALIKEVAPDLDVIGYNSYGHGAVTGASRNLEEVWGRAYYVSEFGPQGPWSGRKTAWGVNAEQPYPAKLDDLRKSFEQIDTAPRCLGSTMFLWGYWRKGKEFPTYFSAFLAPDLATGKVADAKLLVTPIADEFRRYWSGEYPAERAPILTQIAISGRTEGRDTFVPAGQPIRATAQATDVTGNGRPLRYRWWVLDPQGKAVRGPLDTAQPSVEFPALDTAGQHYAVFVYVLAENRFASGFSLPFKVE